ncbi:hypothetical protein DID77_04360 [Candidatus Marinamargulisbacteria bacterium SCGC AG-439-L15]|nr:hypothetical protein DID77_04360 [Candidatus Marinamargulisbacteria bacterium SCGC AG-439-L15]
MKTNTKLGRGLASLIPNKIEDGADRLLEIEIDKIRRNPYQPRVHFERDAIETLSDSIQKHGLHQPILVRQVDDYYELVAGERRYRACIMAERDTIPAIIKTLTNKESLQIALIENLDREDLNAIEIANAYEQLIEEFGLTHDEVATVFSKSRSTITNSLRLLQLPPDVQQMIFEKTLSEGHARALLGCKKQEDMIALAKQVKAQKFSVRALEQLVSALGDDNKPKKKDRSKKLVNPEWEMIKTHLEQKYQSKILFDSDKNTYKMSFLFETEEEFKRLADVLL